MSSLLENFVYKPLPVYSPAIRLLELEPDLKDGLIQCKITNTGIKDARYIALSYTWGPDTDHKSILLNDRPFVVRRNLWDFLRLVRQQRALVDEPLWIDAICINQADISERNRQVPMMASIYNSATRTISWLGGLLDPDGISAFAQSQSADSPIFLKSFDDELERCFQLLETARNRLNHGGNPRLPSYMVVGSVLAVLERICQHPYWTRVWVMQELILSPNRILVVDQLTMHWESVVKILNVVIGANALARTIDKGTSMQTFKEYQKVERSYRHEKKEWYQTAITEMRDHFLANYGYSTTSNILPDHGPGRVTKLLFQVAVPKLATRYELKRLHVRFKGSMIQRLASSISPVYESSVWMGIKTSTTTKGWGAYSTSVTSLDLFSEAACTDRQDKIYGICSLFKEFEGFDVDYSKDIYNLYYRACQALFPALKGYGTNSNAALQLLRNLDLGPVDLVWGGKAQIISSADIQAVVARQAIAGSEHQTSQSRLVGICPHCRKSFKLVPPDSPPDESKFSEGFHSMMLCYRHFAGQKKGSPNNGKLDHIFIYPGWSGMAADAWASDERSSIELNVGEASLGHSYTLRDIVGLVKLHLDHYKLYDVRGSNPRYRKNEWNREKDRLQKSLEAHLTPSSTPPPITMEMLDIMQLEDAAKLNFCLSLRREGLLV